SHSPAPGQAETGNTPFKNDALEFAFHNEARNLLKVLGAALEDRKVTRGLVSQQIRLRTGAFSTQDGNEGRLARLFIAANRFTGGGFVAFSIKQIVDDLERKAKVMRKRAQRLALRR